MTAQPDLVFSGDLLRREEQQVATVERVAQPLDLLVVERDAEVEAAHLGAEPTGEIVEFHGQPSPTVPRSGRASGDVVLRFKNRPHGRR